MPGLGPFYATAQTLDNSALKAKYFFRHVQLVTESTGAISQASSISGSMTFDGAGKLTFQGQQTVGSAPSTTVGGAGTYQVQANGFVSITNPQRSDLLLNARLGAGALVGSSTEAGGTVNDIFIAIPAPTTAVSNGTPLGTFQVATLEFPAGNASLVRDAQFLWYLNGQGGFDPITVTGHAANLTQQISTQTVTGATYAFTTDGSGSAVFPLPSGAASISALFTGKKALYLSADGNLMIGGSLDAGDHDLIIAVRSLGATATASSLQGIFFTAGITLGTAGFGSYAGTANSPGNGSILSTRRYHAAQGTLDATGASTYSLQSDGTGSSETLRLALGDGGSAFLMAAVSDFDLKTFEIDFAIKSPAFSGSGVYISPIGIVNAASFAPVGNPLAPGELFSIFGSGLATQSLGAASFPLPTTLGGVQVTVNGTAVPLIAVSSGQVSAVVPYAATGSKVTVVVNNNGRLSNAVDVPLARTAPGIFSLNTSGAGSGVVLHADYTLVTAASPAKHGETVLIYLTGLGATSPPVGDGLPAPSSNLSLVTTDLGAYIGGNVAPVAFKGLAPGFAALYQINITVPSNAPSGSNIPLAIGTADAFHDQVDIAIQ